MTYREALDYLASIEGLGIKLALRNITAVLGALGDPHRRFRSVLVAGTNGKGSVAAMLESILRAAGHRTGLYTSPHLTRYEERILISGRPVPPEAFAAAVGRVRDASRRLLSSGRLDAHPTHFETVTAAAFLLLAGDASAEGTASWRRETGRSGPASGLRGDDTGRGGPPVEVAVLETGMGGRLDATVLAEPILSLVTNVSLEHTRFLGPDIASIAREKAGVLLGGGTLLAGESRPEALEAFRARARETGGRLVELDRWAWMDPAPGPRLPQWERTGPAWRHAGPGRPPGRSTAGGLDVRFDVTTSRREHRDLRLELPGGHQRRNALLAVAAADLLDGMGVSVRSGAVRAGLASARWPGRFQVMPGSPILILDGAHNPAACGALREALAEGGFDPEALTLLLGVLRDKNAESMLREILPAAARVITTRGLSPRFQDPWVLAGAARRSLSPGGPGASAVAAADELSEGLARAREITPPGGAVCVTGSLYLVGDLMRHLGIDPFAAAAATAGSDA